jgi:hypothetical protein
MICQSFKVQNTMTQPAYFLKNFRFSTSGKAAKNADFRRYRGIIENFPAEGFVSTFKQADFKTGRFQQPYSRFACRLSSSEFSPFFQD